MEIIDILFQFEEKIQDQDWIGLEALAESVCSDITGNEAVSRILAVDLTGYIETITRSFTAVYSRLSALKGKALYFEYDLDNEWHSHFFICDEYQTRDKEDDDWAASWLESVPGPQLTAFSSIYAENGFDENDPAIGITSLLIARTIVAVAKAYRSFSADTKINIERIPFCIGYHDQEILWRIHEKPSKNRSYRVTFPKITRKYPPLAEDERVNLLFEPGFDVLGYLNQGLASAKFDGKYGFVDQYGRRVIPFRFDMVDDFQEGLAPAAINDKWGYIDANGDYVIAPQYDEAKKFLCGGAFVRKKEEWGLIDANGNWLHKPYFNEIGLDYARVDNEGIVSVKKDDKWGYLDCKGKVIIPPVYQCKTVGMFKEGLAGIVLSDRIRYIDTSGKTTFEFTGILNNHKAAAGSFNEGIASINKDVYDSYYINKEGSIIFHAVICNGFSEGFGLVRLPNSRNAFVNNNGDVVIKDGPKKYCNLDGTIEKVTVNFVGSRFSQGLAQVFCKADTGWGYIDKSGELVMKFDYFVSDFNNNVAVFKGIRGKQGYINKQGRLLITPQFEACFDFYDLITKVKLNDKWAFVEYIFKK